MNIKNLSHKISMKMTGFFAQMMPGSDHMLFAGEHSSRQLCLHIARDGLRRILVVTDKPLLALGVVNQAIKALPEHGIETFIYDGVLPDPTFQIVTDGLLVAKQNTCDAVLAIGGGSAIDSAKVIAMAMTNLGDAAAYIGFGKVKEKPLPLFAIATTSGTGSEATMGAVVSDSTTHEKVIIADGKMQPLAVALDPLLLTGLPPHITAATGMDALTHAIEAYIGIWDHGNCQDQAKLATKLIFHYLPIAYESGSDITARDAMAYAAYSAGLAINKVNTGNVHAIAHQLGGRYGVPHGLGNACVLPHVLDFSLPAAETRLAELAQLLDLGDAEDSSSQLAIKFVAAVRELNRRIGISDVVRELKTEDIPALTAAAVKEASAYPVPRVMSEEECSNILHQLVAT